VPPSLLLRAAGGPANAPPSRLPNILAAGRSQRQRQLRERIGRDLLGARCQAQPSAPVARNRSRATAKTFSDRRRPSGRWRSRDSSNCLLFGTATAHNRLRCASRQDVDRRVGLSLPSGRLRHSRLVPARCCFRARACG
jgi:hypothetical protein